MTSQREERRDLSKDDEWCWRKAAVEKQDAMQPYFLALMSSYDFRKTTFNIQCSINADIMLKKCMPYTFIISDFKINAKNSVDP